MSLRHFLLLHSPPHRSLLRCALIMLIALLAPPGGPAAAAETFKSWRAACLEGACAAEATSRGGSVVLRISRLAGAAAPWHVSLHGLDIPAKAATHLGFWVNGKRALRLIGPAALRRVGGTYFVADDTALAALFPGLRGGRRLAITAARPEAGRQTHSFSLYGLEEALAWIDQQQTRTGSRQSVAAPGEPGRALAQRTGPAAPTGAALPRAPALPPAVASAHGTAAACELPDRQPEIYREGIVRAPLDAVNTLYLLPCTAGAYATSFRVYVHDKRYPGDARPEYFAAYSKQRGWYGKSELLNVEYAPETKTLTAREIGRALGDCGSLARYRWTADGLRLLSYRHWPRCNGSRMSDDWPLVYEYGKAPRR